ncbi:MAG TPA: hypothetical protein VGI60_02715 [Chthoniobacterales bacterium]|jgi:hypothetical protein
MNYDTKSSSSSNDEQTVNTTEKRILRAANLVGKLFEEFTKEALRRLNKAEDEALERLRDYVPTERLMTLKEAAAYLNFSTRWLDEGTGAKRKTPIVPVIRIGASKRFSKRAIDQHLAQMEVGHKINLVTGRYY